MTNFGSSYTRQTFSFSMIAVHDLGAIFVIQRTFRPLLSMFSMTQIAGNALLIQSNSLNIFSGRSLDETETGYNFDLIVCFTTIIFSGFIRMLVCYVVAGV